MTTTLRTFHHDEVGYRAWLDSADPLAWVLNEWGDGPDDRMLHHASCSHINYVDDNMYTETRKLCGAYIRDLRDRLILGYQSCSDCQ